MIKPLIIIATTTGVLACLLYGPMTKQIGNGSQITADIYDIRTINTGLLSYYINNNDKYPNSLQEIVDEGFVKQEDIKLWQLSVYYIKDHSVDDGTDIILYTSTYPSDKEHNPNDGVISYVDGFAQRVTRPELEKLLAQEIEKLRAVQLPPISNN